MSTRESLFNRITGGFFATGGTADVETEAVHDPEEMPATVSSESMKRMFQLQQINRLVSVVDQIDMRLLRELFNNATSGFIGELIDVYVQMEAADSRLQGMLGSRRKAVSRTRPVVTTPDEDNEQAVAARDLVLGNIEHVKFNEFRRAAMDGPLYGAALFENIWKRRPDGTLIIDKIKQVDHTLIEQYNLHVGGASRFISGQPAGEFGKIVLRPDNLSPKRIFLDELPPYKLMSFYRANRDGYHDLEGVMRSVARLYVLKVFLMRVWAQYAEVFGMPTVIAKVNENDFKSNKSTIKKMLQSVGLNRYGIFFKNMEYELHEATNSAAAVDVFDKYLALLNTEASIAILGQNLTSEVSGGSRAASETHLEVLNAITADDLEIIDEVIQSDFINPIVRVNFPSLPAELYPSYRSVQSKAVDLQKLGLGIQAMSKSIEIPKSWIYEQAQIPQPDEGEDVVFTGGADAALQGLINGGTN